MYDSQDILTALNIKEEILGIFPYGSRVYGLAKDDSDYDYIVVTKSSFLPSGAFKQNAISSSDKNIQGVLYSRSGFIDAINNYEIAALECLSLDPANIIILKWPFKIQKWDEKEMVKKIIQKASASWHIASEQSRNDQKHLAKKGVFHALRILMFGIQLKEYKKITNFSVSNELKHKIERLPDDMFDDRLYLKLRDELINTIKNG
jgi:predicted nucleotidyltransferase